MVTRFGLAWFKRRVVVAAIDVVVVAIITIEWIQWQFTKTGCSKGHFSTFFSVLHPSVCLDCVCLVLLDTKFDDIVIVQDKHHSFIRSFASLVRFWQFNYAVCYFSSAWVWKTMIANTIQSISFKYQLDMLFSFNAIARVFVFPLFHFAQYLYIFVCLSTFFFAHQTFVKPEKFVILFIRIKINDEKKIER